MLGKLARELRLLGIDCAYEKELNSNLLFRKAKQSARIFLTRNTKLKTQTGTIFINSEKVVEQVQQILNTFADNLVIRPMSRCLNCNEILIEQAKANIKSKVPFYVYQTCERFYACPKCQKIYWRGTHYQDMQNRVRQYLKNRNA